MRLEYYPEEKLKKEILDILKKRLNLERYRVFFFGSRVSQTGTDRSDIDIGIEGDQPIPVRLFSDIQEEIEKIPTLYKIEIVDFKRVPEKFKKVALKYKEPVTQ